MGSIWMGRTPEGGAPGTQAPGKGYADYRNLIREKFRTFVTGPGSAGVSFINSKIYYAMKNDPYFKFIAVCIVLGVLLAVVSTHVHAAVPLPPVHVIAKAPHWQNALNHPVVRAAGLGQAHVAMTPAALAPALPAPAPVRFSLGS
jgi:hypothetical protein